VAYLIGKKLAPSSDSKTTSSGKKKSVRKAVNLSGLLSSSFHLFLSDHLPLLHSRSSLELQRYFHAAEEAAREIMLEDAIKANYSNQTNQNVNNGNGNDRDGVFQLTTLSSLPLKSPKRLIALQLANNNPAFRDRFRNKLEQTGGPLAMGGNNNQKGGNNNNYLSSAQAGSAGYNNYQGDHNQNNMNNQHESAYSFEGELEKLINTPDWMRNGGAADSNTLFNTAMNGRSFLNQSDYSQHQQQNNYNQNNNRFASKEGRGGGGTRGRSRSRENEIDANGGYDHPKLRQKRRKELDTDDINDQLYDGSNGGTGGSSLTSRIPDYSNSHYNLRGHNPHSLNMNDNSNDSSIIKRRRKGELQIMVDGSLGNTANALPSAGPLTNAIRANNLHSLMGGGLLTNDHNNLNSLMGPPGETPTRRSARLKSGSLSTMSNLGKVPLVS
jgi:hypothetical protein